MSVRSLNWLKFGGLVAFAFVIGLLFASLLDVPTTTLAQERKSVTGEVIPASNPQVAERVSNGTAAASLITLSDAFADVAETVRPSVVYIRSRRTERVIDQRRVPQGLEEFFGVPRNRGRNEPQVETGSGSGFIVSNDGYILTNNHVVDGADQVMVRLLDRREYPAKVIGTDPTTDVAVIKIEAARGTALRPVRLGSSSKSRVGEWVLAVGNPLSENLSFTVTSGIISAKGRGQLPLPGRSERSIQDFIQTDAAINRGNSGGPLLNVRGEVIGINSAIFSPTGVSAGYAFAVPIDLARQVMDQLISKGHVERAALGVQVTDASPEDAEWAGLDGVYGAKINDFPPNSPARNAGLQQGDIVIGIDGNRVEYVAQLQQLVGFRKAGESVKVEVARKGGTRRTFDVRLVGQDATSPEAQIASGRAEPGTDAAPALRDRLGINGSALSAEMAQQLRLPGTTKGVVVESVDPYGPADGLLISGGLIHIITAIEDKPVGTEAELSAALRSYQPGTVVSLNVLEYARGDERPATRIVRIRLK